MSSGSELEVFSLDADTKVFEDGKVSLSAWNGESRLDLYPFTDLTDTDKALSVDSAVFYSSEFEFKFYEIKEGYEYEILFKTRPSLSSIELSFDLTNFVLYYQPPLNEIYGSKGFDLVNETHVILNGSVVDYRPLNVVGSYAVFHSSKRGNEYTTGKAFHLYTVQLIDAKGWSVYVPYNRDAQQTGKLVIELPDEFMEKAVYPVLLDPTFGKTDIGGSEWTKSIDRQIACKYSLSETGTVVSIHAYIGCDPTGLVRGGIYDDSGSNTPLNLDGYSDGHSVDVSFEWETFTLLSSVEETAGSYWLAVHNQQPIGFKYDSGAAGQTNYFYRLYSSGFSDPWGSGTGEARALSIYATYTTEQFFAFFYHTALGKFIVNGSMVANGTSWTITDQTLLQLIGAPETNRTWIKFNLNGTDYTNNFFNLTVDETANSILWCYFGEGGGDYILDYDEILNSEMDMTLTVFLILLLVFGCSCLGYFFPFIGMGAILIGLVTFVYLPADEFTIILFSVVQVLAVFFTLMGFHEGKKREERRKKR